MPNRQILSLFRIILDDVALTHLTFSNEFTSAVEQKQIAQQKAEMARYRVEEAEQRKLAAVIRAEGDAEAAKLVSDVRFFDLFLKIYFYSGHAKIRRRSDRNAKA